MARSEEAVQELAKMSPVFEKAKKALEALPGKPEVQEIARQRELALLTYKLELGEAKAEGERVGREQGERVGREQGERAGREQGERGGAGGGVGGAPRAAPPPRASPRPRR